MFALAISLVAATAHVPFFVDTHSAIQKDNSVSQAYYFKDGGQLEATSPDRLPYNTKVEVVFSRKCTDCSATVMCDGQSEFREFRDTSDEHVEPFTQSTYHKAYSEDVTCNSSFSVTGTSTVPWAAVVGTGEHFTPTELLEFPIYIARIHGSWWNKAYIAGWPLLVGLLYFLGRWLMVHDVEPRREVVHVALLFFSVSFFDKLIHVLMFGRSWAAFLLPFLVEWPPAAVGVWLLYPWYTYRYAIAALATWAGTTFMFFGGSGYLLGNPLLVVAGAWALLRPGQTDLIRVNM